MFLVLDPDTLIGYVKGNTDASSRVLDNGDNGNYWRDVVFRDSLPLGNQLSLKTSFQLMREQLWTQFKSPHILILTATDSIQEDLNSTVFEFIETEMVQVDVLTFSELKNSFLLTLAKYGNIFASNLISK